MNEDKFDAIIIGAGPAGVACAYRLAKGGKNILVIERADRPGSKNVTGGRFYTYALDSVDEGLAREAVLERRVDHEQIMLISNQRALTIDFHDFSLANGEPFAQSYTLLRTTFDEWFATKAEEQGAMIVSGIRVDNLIEKDSKIIGVIAGEDEMYADCVIAADGVNSLIAQKAGLIHDLNPKTIALGVKEIIEMPPNTIEQRFSLKTDEGAARLILGCTEGVHGGGFLYTNKASISLGIVAMPEELAKHGRSVHDIYQDVKMHPSIYPLIEGGKTVEYAAHLVAEAGYQGIPTRLYREGFLVVGEAGGFAVNLGYTVRGIDLSILSGVAAANAILTSDKPADIGPNYMRELEKIKLLPIMRAVDRFTDVMEIPRLFRSYPDFATDIFHKLYQVDGEAPERIKKIIIGSMKEEDLSLVQLLKDSTTMMRIL